MKTLYRVLWFWLLLLIEPAAAQSQPYAEHLSLHRAGNRFLEAKDDYTDRIQPILARYCMGCHSCTNGPCQLNMTSYEGLARGMLNVDPYKSVTLGTPDTRLSHNWSVEQWRKLGFTSVLPDPENGEAAEDSLLFLALELGRERNTKLAFPEARTFASQHMQQKYECPTTAAAFRRLTSKHQLGGMPLGLAAIPDSELLTLMDWVKAGAQGPGAEAQKFLREPQRSSFSSKVIAPNAVVLKWEDFFNRDDLRYQLVARYIYEHTFLAHIELEENPGEFYQIVRSTTPAPEPIAKITTELPMDHPGTEGRVYYRLEKIARVIEAKTHTVWHLNLKKLAYFERLFMLDQPWPQGPLTKLPGYTSINPFVYFEAIPVLARARFMIQESKIINQAIARGPICFDQAAANGVDEYFWKWFLKPEQDPSVLDPKLGLASYSDFYPAYKEKTAILDDLAEQRYRRAFERTLRRVKPEGITLDDIWLGDNWSPKGEAAEKNPNAWLAIYRHQFTAEVLTGTQKSLPGFPRSVQLISYAAHERIYYNEAARFRYWASSLHKLDTWNWVMYTRTESEDFFAALFSDDDYRQSLRNRMTEPAFRIFVGLEDYAKGRNTRDNRGESEYSLAQTMMQRMGPEVVGTKDELNNWPLTQLTRGIPDDISNLEQWEQGLRTLTGENGLNSSRFARYLPNIIHVRLGQKLLYSLTVNRGYAYTKRSEPGLEKASRRPEKDRLHAVRGFMGVTPYLYVDLAFSDAAAFLREIATLDSEDDLLRFKSKPFVLRRHDPKVWSFTEWLEQKAVEEDPSEAGLLDLRYYDAEDKPF